MMLPVEIIRRKRDGHSLSAKEMEDFFSGFASDTLADYQITAMLMAIFLNGMSKEETANLTKLMRDSGKILSWTATPELIVDKHSTGGVGDKTSLVILPLCALYGVTVPMMSGRGLGHTGGTLDKLESIPGMNVFQDPTNARRIAGKHGGVFLGQTADLAPLDKKLYALRDVTATVESIPLITASILSKKLAEGIGSLVMDVKFGSGAFMGDLSKARKLAKSISGVASECGLKIRCLLTNMNTPLGDTAGNSLEVNECLEVFRGAGPADTRTLCVELAAQMLEISLGKSVPANIRAKLQADLSSGRAFEKFCAIISDQGGDSRVFEKFSSYAPAPIKRKVYANATGWVSRIDVRELGLSVVALGGGRRRADDKINHSVGLSHIIHVGASIAADQPLLEIHAQSESDADIAMAMVKKAYTISSTPCRKENLVAEVI